MELRCQLKSELIIAHQAPVVRRRHVQTNWHDNTPDGNRIAINVDIESKPKLLIDIATSTDSSEGAMKVISLTFRHLYEAFDRDEKRAVAFVECIASTKFDNVLVISMSNDQVIMAEALARCPVGHDKLVELAKQAIARVATAVAIDYVVSVR